MIVSASGDETPHIESLNSVDTADGRVLTIIYPLIASVDQPPLLFGSASGEAGSLAEASCPAGGSVTFLYDAPAGVWRVISTFSGQVV